MHTCAITANVRMDCADRSWLSHHDCISTLLLPTGYTHSSLATSTAENWANYIEIPAYLLVSGVNVVAVEVHQVRIQL
jgi:hypothetical protein